MPLPVLQLADDAQRMAGAVGLGEVAGEPLVGHVRVVLERTQGLHDVDVSPFPAPGERGRQLRSPGGGLDERGEVDVVGHPARLEVGAVAGHQLVADRERGLRPVVERPLDVLAALVGHGHVGIRDHSLIFRSHIAPLLDCLTTRSHGTVVRPRWAVEERAVAAARVRLMLPRRCTLITASHSSSDILTSIRSRRIPTTIRADDVIPISIESVLKQGLGAFVCRHVVAVCGCFSARGPNFGSNAARAVVPGVNVVDNDMSSFCRACQCVSAP